MLNYYLTDYVNLFIINLIFCCQGNVISQNTCFNYYLSECLEYTVLDYFFILKILKEFHQKTINFAYFALKLALFLISIVDI